MDNLKRVVFQEEVGIITFDLNNLYTAREFANKINEGLEKTPGNYILLDCNSEENPSEVYMNIVSGREETDDEFNMRMVREKRDNNDFILRQEKDEYIQFLSLKAKFEKR